MGHADEVQARDGVVTRRAVLAGGLAAGAYGLVSPAVAMAANAPLREFRVEWGAGHLDALRQQIKAFRFPRPIPGSGWRYGVDSDYLRTLVDYWADGFDMEAAARDLNRFPQYVTRVENLDIHFIRVTGEEGPNKARRPLLLTHGWPGSTYEFWETIGPLAFPSKHGAPGAMSFDVIVPSLPGFGPSSKPSSPVGARTTARLWDTLMRQNLGYQDYYAAGGDWGAGVTGWLALDFPDPVKAIHLNLMIAAPEVPSPTEAERTFYREAEAYEQRWGAYYQLQATEPQSLALAMTSDPVAQAAWLIQRFRHWSDTRTRSFEQVFSMDQLLTNVMIYVMNDAFQTSTWFYTGCAEEGVTRMPQGVRVETPTGFAAYPGDGRSPNPPRRLVERGYNIQHWSEIPNGGHFAAMEVPDLYVRDLRNWGQALNL